MALVVTNVGAVELLSRSLNKSAPGDLKLKLFANNPTLSKSTLVGALTEASASGYAAKTLAGASWSVATVGDVTEGSFAEQVFNLTAAQVAYGYYVTNLDGSKLLWAEKFEAVYNIPTGGGSISVVPKIKANSV